MFCKALSQAKAKLSCPLSSVHGPPEGTTTQGISQISATLFSAIRNKWDLWKCIVPKLVRGGGLVVFISYYLNVYIYGAAVVQWDRARFVSPRVLKRTGSNPGHGPRW
ncbi:hypothetical protein E2C01_049911 [Portunus trituberculatus]|uniref:Uncharacterized protein n=1 Tax=Portunus trituberculatus TaxID=210409 RepID=A0A5B7GF47_PORTR|nr:hypothetical protein [Portunus trituberculatus]